MSFLIEAGAMLAVSLLLLFSLSSVGIAFTARFIVAEENALFVPLSIAFGIAVHGGIGFFVAIIPIEKRATAAILLGLANLVALVAHARAWPSLKSVLVHAKWPLALWAAASVLYGLVTFYPARPPEVMIDGPYVVKKDILPVRIQSLVGDLPIDNQIPDVVSEFLLRGLSFTKNRPLVPGQEISDRPILMPLVVVPVRALLGPIKHSPEVLPTFSYVGTNWPDFSILLSDETYRQFLAVAVPLNATIILAFWYLGVTFGFGEGLLLVTTVALMLLSPYVVMHSIFTWPKNLAATFVLIGIIVTQHRQSARIAGTLFGLAYWCHPYAIVFAGAFGLYHLIEYHRKRASAAHPILYASAFGITVAPWFIWTRLIMHIPSSIIAQNLARHVGLLNHVWYRLYNTTTLLFPVAFATPEFSAVPFVRSLMISLVGMVGIPFALPGLYAVFRYMNRYQYLPLYSVIIPGLLLIAVFSMPAVPAMHGWQAISPIILLLGIKLLQEVLHQRIIVALIVIQAVINIGIMSVYARDRMPACPSNANTCTLYQRLSGVS